METAQSQAEAKVKAAEEAKAVAEEVKAVAKAKKQAAGKFTAFAASSKRATVEAQQAAKANVLLLQAEVEEVKGVVSRREEAWPPKKKRIALVLAASNKRAQSALAEEFPEIVEKFDISKKGMEAVLNALKSVKLGAPRVGTNGAGASPRKL